MREALFTRRRDLRGRIAAMQPVINVIYSSAATPAKSLQSAEQPSRRLNTRPIPPDGKMPRAAKRHAALYHARPLLSLYPNERI